MKFYEQGHLGGYIISDEKYLHSDPMTFSPQLWKLLINKLKVKSVIDIGCGEGHAAIFFMKHGINTKGVDGCNNQLLPKDNFILHDYITAPLTVPSTDLGWCCEVVEHIPESHITNFMATFKCCKFIAMTHAFPGQGGYHHVNERPARYWINIMKQNNFVLMKKLTNLSKTKVTKNHHWYRSGMIFRQIY